MSESGSITSGSISADLSSISEDGEIEREPRHKKRRRNKYDYLETHHRRKEGTRTEKANDSSPERKHRSDDHSGSRHYQTSQDEDPDDEFDDMEAEDYLTIKPPQARSKSHSSKCRRRDKEDIRYDNRNYEVPRKLEEPRHSRHSKREVDEHFSRHEIRQRRRKEDKLELRTSKHQTRRDRHKNKERDKRAKDSERRWTVLDEREKYFSENENKRRKDRLYKSKKYAKREDYDEELRSRVKSPSQEQSTAPIPTTSSKVSLLSTVSTKPKQDTKRMTSLIEVQEFEMSENEIDCGSDSGSHTPSGGSDANSNNSENVESPAEEKEVKNEEKEESKETKSVVEELIPYYPAIQGCRSVEEFDRLNKIEEGTYGVVFRAECKRTKAIVALKRLKMEKEKEGFPITSLREINTLLKAQHPNVVNLKEIVVGSNIDRVYIVMEYVEHDLKTLMKTMKRDFTIGEVKTLMIQLLRAVAHLHDNWILHRDLKASNLLFSHQGILKVGDFGLAREYGSPLKAYTPVVVTLWYRAPELLLQAKEYSCPIDLWSVGCIFAEFLTSSALFQGKTEQDQLKIIFETLGTPSEKIWPGYNELPVVKQLVFQEHKYNNLQEKLGKPSLSESGFDLMNRFLTYCPEKRITAEQALKHEFFKESPLPINPSMFSTWPAKSEQGLRKVQSPKPPSGGKLFSKLGDDDEKFGISHAKKGMEFSLKF